MTIEVISKLASKCASFEITSIEMGMQLDIGYHILKMGAGLIAFQ